MMENIKVSVIVPVYNSSVFLRQTLDSLTHQTLKEIEIICVDDGSTDDSYDILKEYSEQYSNIIVIRQGNGGAGAARNAGLDKAIGEYLSFLDADDFFETDMLEKAYEHAKKYNADVTVFNSDQYYEETNEYKKVNWVVRYNKIPPYNPFKHRQMTDNIFKVFVGWAWDKLFKREYIERYNIRFQEQRTSNDLLFVFSAIVLADRISVLNREDILIHQRRNNSGSLSNTREKSWDCFYSALTALKTRLVQEGIYKEVERDYINYALHFSLWNLNSLAEPTHTVLKDRLLSEWFRELGIADKPEEYFYNKKEYKQYKDML